MLNFFFFGEHALYYLLFFKNQTDMPYNYPVRTSLNIHFGILLITIFFFSACKQEAGIEVSYEVIEITDEEASRTAAEIREDVNLDISSNLEVTLWASENLLADPAGINFDHKGRAWVATTNRRRSTVPDAGAVDFWMIDNLSWTSLEDRRQFIREALAPEKSDENTWMEDFNQDGSHDWRDMLVEKDPVYLLEDPSGSGAASRATIMDWDNYSEVTEITGSVLYHNGELFVARIPDLLRIQDTNSDGIFNSVESISHGYGVHFGYSGHGKSSLQMGPDGRIWWTIGDVGVNVVDQDGKRWYYPHEGAIMRSDVDGSNFEVFATGLRNIHEFSFDKYGNLFAVDNDGPAGDYDRLVYPTDGSDSGWRIHWQMGKANDPKNNEYSVWVNEEYFSIPFDGQTAHILPPLEPSFRGPAGFTYNPGTALSEEWQDHFFASSFVGSPTNSGINAFTLKKEGASFRKDSVRTVLRGVLSTSLDFGTDGALYTADWVAGWITSETGRIWRIDTPDRDLEQKREETRQTLAKDFREVPSQDLQEYLAHEDMRVRRNAQFELASRIETEIFQNMIEQQNSQMARIHSIWGLGQVARLNDVDFVTPLVGLLEDNDAEIRAQAARTLGDVRFEPAGDALLLLLEDHDARVRYFAAEALGRIAYSPAVEPIIEMVRENDDLDLYLRQAGAIALSRIAEPDELLQWKDDPSDAVRTVVLITLNRLKSPHVVDFLDDVNEQIVTDAARAINDEEFIEEGLEALSMMLLQNRFTSEPILRRAVNAALYRGERADAERLAVFSLRDDLPEDLRVEAMETLSVWPEPSLMDRVTGKYRGPVYNDKEVAREAASPAIVQILEHSSGENLQLAALKTAGELNASEAVPAIVELWNSRSSEAIQTAVLDILHKLDYENMDEIAAANLNHESPEVRLHALEYIAETGLQSEDLLELFAMILDNGSAEERQTALAILGRMDDPESIELLEEQLLLLMNDQAPQEIRLDIILAAESSGSEELQNQLQLYEDSKSETPLVRYSEALYGGNAESGDRIFHNHQGAQCYRCHTGGEAGPLLDEVGDRLSREQLLEAMINPNARIAEGFGVVRLTLNNGEVISGILRSETENSLVVTAADYRWEIDKSEIDERSNSPSPMPSMSGILTRSELRDLVEYLYLQRSSD
jgi:quinoprotein glucose dehydrogenase